MPTWHQRTDKCVRRLQTIASRGLAIEAHVGDLPKSAKWGGVGKGNQCIDGDTNSLAAFLIGAGKYSYYHCSYDPETWVRPEGLTTLSPPLPLPLSLSLFSPTPAQRTEGGLC